MPGSIELECFVMKKTFRVINMVISSSKFFEEDLRSAIPNKYFLEIHILDSPNYLFKPN